MRAPRVEESTPAGGKRMLRGPRFAPWSAPLLAAAVGWTGAAAVADETKADAPAKPDYRLQSSDDAAPPLKAVQGRSAEGQQGVEAMSWYLTGRLFESRNDRRRAFDAYQRAVQLNEKGAAIYRQLVPLAFELDKPEQAIEYAIKAIDLDPTNFEVLHQLGIQLASQRRVAEAIKYLEQATESPGLPKNSRTYVMISRDLGILYAATNQVDKAADRYTILFEAVQNAQDYHLDPRTRAALLADPRTNYEKIGQILIEAKRVEPAAKAFELAAKTGRTSAGNLNYYQAKVLLLSGKPEEALAELQKYFDAQRQSKGREAYQLLADALEKLNRQDELIGRLQTLAEKDPRNTALQFFLADRYVAVNELDKARAIYESSLKGSSDVQAFVGLVKIYRLQKKADELVDMLGRGLTKATPESLEALEAELKTISEDGPLVTSLVEAARAQGKAEPATLTFEEAYIVAKAAAEAKHVDEAVELFEAAIPLANGREGLAYGDLGDLLLREERYAAAADLYERAVATRTLADNRPNYLYKLSQAREMNGETDKAIEAVNDALKINPKNALLQFQLGWILYHSRQLDKALEQFAEVEKTFAESDSAAVKAVLRQVQFSISNIHVLKGDLRKGQEVLEKVYEEEPDDVSVNNDLGYLYADQGVKLEQAEKMIRKAVEAEPENGAYQDSLGWVLYKREKYQEALEPLEKAVKLRTGGDGTVYEHLGDVYDKLGKKEQAVEAWKKAMEELKDEKHPDEKLKARLEEKLGKK